MDLIALRKKLDAIPIANVQVRLANNQVANFLAFKSAVDELATIPPLAQIAREIQLLPIYQQTNQVFPIDANTALQLRQRSDALFTTATALTQILRDAVPKLPPETLIITLPSANDLSTTTNFLDQFQKCLAPLAFETGIDGKIEVIHWQSGSLLVFIFVGTMSAVTIIARTLKAAAIAYQEIQKGRATAVHVDLLKEHVREQKFKADLAGVIAEAQKERIKTVVDHESKAVELEVFHDTQNERLERIKYSVRGLADLFGEGATISPALDMPQEEQAKFPDVEHLLTVTPPIKQLQAAEPATQADPNAPTANT
jgi:hypothetical protein